MTLSPELIKLTQRQTTAGTVVDGVRQPELTQEQREKIVDLNSGRLPQEDFNMDKIRRLWKQQGNNENLSPEDRDYLATFYNAQPVRR